MGRVSASCLLWQVLELYLFVRLQLYAGFGACADIERSHFSYQVSGVV